MNQKFLFLLGSARSGGNTEYLAREAAQQLPTEATQTWISLAEYPLPYFEDLRHAENKHYHLNQPNEQYLLEATLACTDLVIVSPLYWYNLSASLKLYFDYWTAWLRMAEINFRSNMTGKTLWNVTTLADEETRYAQPLIQSLQMTAEYMDMRWAGSLLGYANRPLDIQKDTNALSKAQYFFKK